MLVGPLQLATALMEPGGREGHGPTSSHVVLLLLRPDPVTSA